MSDKTQGNEKSGEAQVESAPSRRWAELVRELDAIPYVLAPSGAGMVPANIERWNAIKDEMGALYPNGMSQDEVNENYAELERLKAAPLSLEGPLRLEAGKRYVSEKGLVTEPLEVCVNGGFHNGIAIIGVWNQDGSLHCKNGFTVKNFGRLLREYTPQNEGDVDGSSKAVTAPEAKGPDHLHILRYTSKALRQLDRHFHADDLDLVTAKFSTLRAEVSRLTEERDTALARVEMFRGENGALRKALEGFWDKGWTREALDAAKLVLFPNGDAITSTPKTQEGGALE